MSFAVSNSWLRQSNAFERSISKARKDLPLSTGFFHFSNKFKRRCYILSYLPKPRTSQNKPKPAEITKTKLRKDPKQSKISKLGKFGIFYFSFFKFLAQILKFRHFGAEKYQFSNHLTKFCLYSISKGLISNLTFVFQNLEPKCPNLGILHQKVLTF